MASLLNGGTDLLTGQGFEQADVAASQGNNANGGAVAGGSFAPFAAIGGGSMKIKSGSHVDNKAFGISLGFAKKFENRQGTLLFGPLFEYGRGNYDSYLDSGVHGWGKSSYFGGGIFAKQKNHDGLYYEGSLRAGRMKADYSGNLAAGVNANYDTSSTYFAAHLGIGKVFAVKNGDNVDAYLKYFFSHTGGDDVTVHGNLNDERYHFDSVNSSRLRLGFRYNHPLNDKSKLYAGLAWQYEFDGQARATYNGLSTPSPSLKGSSGMAELGWQVKPGNAPLTLDLGITGWAGKQQGVTASLKANWEF